MASNTNHLVSRRDLNIPKTRRRNDRSRVPSFHSIAWHSGLVSLLLMKGGVAQAEDDFPTFDLHPTSILAVLKQRRRLMNNSLLSAEDIMEEDWFHPNHTNAIYAALPKKEDMVHELFQGDEMLADFHRYRHLSRHERQFREQNNMDLQPDWDGIYNFEDDDEEVDDDENNYIEDTTILLENNNGTITRMENATNETTQRRLQRFNNYQAIALSQGYGTHYAHAWVGSPTPQRKTLIVDTGSHYTAFPCKGCRNCGDHTSDQYYDFEQSDDFHVLQCNECREGVQCQGERCVFSQSYTEGSSWEAYQVRDKFYCGGNDFLGAVDPKDQKYVIDFMFGCQLSLNG
jgi:Xylanase inhibitor N-terminal